MDRNSSLQDFKKTISQDGIQPVSVLTIAGSDPSGGAGIQQDLKTFAALGVYGMAVITALTIQNTKGVKAVYPVEAEIVRAQTENVLEDIVPDVVKTGMLVDKKIVSAVAENIALFKPRLVIDPVMVSSSGTALLDRQGRNAVQELLFSYADLITPNIPEAEYLSDTDISNMQEMRIAAEKISKASSWSDKAPAVLIKGGHLKGKEPVDILFYEEKFYEFPHTRIPRKDVHGTGCLLSAAAAAFMVKGNDLVSAVSNAIRFTRLSIQNALCLGSGANPANPLFLNKSLIEG